MLYSIPQVSNPPLGPVHHEQLHSAAECDRLLAELEAKEWQHGIDVSCHTPTDGAGIASARHQLRQPLAIDASGAPLAALAGVAAKANAALWGFDLEGFVGDDPPWAVKYVPAPPCQCDWRVDLAGAFVASRKLAITVQLSDPADYTGGDLEYLGLDLDHRALRRRGTIIIFPAYWPHRMAPLVSGTRVALMGWVHGPSFR